MLSATLLAAVLSAAPAAALDLPPDEPRIGPMFVVGADLGTYGVGSGVSGPSLAVKLGIGLRREALGIALIGEADYGVVSIPIEAPTGNRWVLPQLDISFFEGGARFHAFGGIGWGRFVDGSRASVQRNVTLFGGGVGVGYGLFDATVRYLAPDTALQASGSSRQPQYVPGLGAQLTVGLRLDLVP